MVLKEKKQFIKIKKAYATTTLQKNIGNFTSQKPYLKSI